MKQSSFIVAKSEYMDKLKMYVPIVDRVHGKLHPEFHEVRRVFELLNDKLNQNNLDLKTEFEALKVITNHYKVPHDVCESYEAVYQMLDELNKAYDESAVI
ncbi:iron-sulfur cluster repair di-iron protein, ric [Acholeplasma laidlawii]|uniref:iron-sulfur cluster repair di-iron protein, ric n=1 Tax=Acholeplasma laidlawii TaxID=2148 RepID=UPI0018C3449D|nr:iron-sulfur cluster repair di-iron protein, ric [Acholeplasma laidlawii]MBG0762031.1 iron-sulfur cluster repair di-iron protein, ric [Acholeplasma laidlawii]